MGSYEELLNSGDAGSTLFDVGMDGENLKVTTEKIPIDNIVISEFKKVSRGNTIIGLNSIIEQWGVINDVHVLKLEDDDMYMLLDGLRRVYSAVKNGITELECKVWDFNDKAAGKKKARLISLMLNRHERYDAVELWNIMQILEDADELNSGMIEYLTQMPTGQAMKLKEVMTCEFDYVDIREKLVAGTIDIEAAYKKLCNERKKENRLEREDDTAVENTVAEELKVDDDNQKLSDDEVADKLELDKRTNLSEANVEDLLAEAEVDVSAEDIKSLDMTNEIRGNDMYQTTDERHIVDKEVKQGTFIRDNFHCRCCGKGGAHWLGVLIFHHAIPVYAGGPDTVDNGLTLCQDCHMTLHNYIQGKVQVSIDSLPDEDVATFKNIFKYGNIALKAVKHKGIAMKELREMDKSGSHHAYPDAYLKENTEMYKKSGAGEG